MTYLVGLNLKCVVCNKLVESASQTDLNTHNLFNRNLESKFACLQCWNEREKHICVIKNCRVLKEPNSLYCIRHDENSIVSPPEIPELI